MPWSSIRRLRGSALQKSACFRGGSEGNPDYECLRSELKKMAPPNGRTVLLFWAPCWLPPCQTRGLRSKKGKHHKSSSSARLGQCSLARKLDLKENKIVDVIKFDVGNVVMVTGGRNRGRVGVIKNREKHKGSFETIHVQDATGHEFATCMGNVFTIGKGTKPWVSLPKGKDIKLSIIKEARKRIAAQQATTASNPFRMNRLECLVVLFNVFGFVISFVSDFIR
ncbi:40S ribosomal protein S4-1 [Spatholobus suberectus]|nr:40S ribosomal protein S4-1 [Spatholobus suberectus]